MPFRHLLPSATGTQRAHRRAVGARPSRVRSRMNDTTTAVRAALPLPKPAPPDLPHPALQPQEMGSAPRMQTYELEERRHDAVHRPQRASREAGSDVAVRLRVRAGICGSCAMMVNGRPTLACRMLTRDVGPEITLAPLPVFELIGDLRSTPASGCGARASASRPGCTQRRGGDLTRLERADGPRARREAERARPLRRVRLLRGCVRTARMRATSWAPWPLQDRRFRLDPRDARTDDDYYELIGDDNGVFGCMSLLACHDVCRRTCRCRPRSRSAAQAGRQGLGLSEAREASTERRTAARAAGGKAVGRAAACGGAADAARFR